MKDCTACGRVGRTLAGQRRQLNLFCASSERRALLPVATGLGRRYRHRPRKCKEKRAAAEQASPRRVSNLQRTFPTSRDALPGYRRLPEDSRGAALRRSDKSFHPMSIRVSDGPGRMYTLPDPSFALAVVTAPAKEPKSCDRSMLQSQPRCSVATSAGRSTEAPSRCRVRSLHPVERSRACSTLPRFLGVAAKVPRRGCHVGLLCASLRIDCSVFGSSPFCPSHQHCITPFSGAQGVSRVMSQHELWIRCAVLFREPILKCA